MPLVLAAVVVYLVIGMVTMDVPSNADFPGPRFFPAIIAGVMALLIVIQTVTAVRQWRAGTLVELGEDDDQRRQSDLVVEAGTRERLDVKALAWLVGSFAAFALLLEILGWVIAAGLLFWCIAHAFGSRRHLLDLGGGADRLLGRLHRLRHAAGAVPALRHPGMGVLTWTRSPR